MAGNHRSPKPRRSPRLWPRRRPVPAWTQLEPAESVEPDPAADAIVPEFDSTLLFGPDFADRVLNYRPPTTAALPRRRKKWWLALAGTTAAAGLAVAASIAWLTVGVSMVKPDSDANVTSAIRQHWAAGSTSSDANFVGIIRIPRFGKSWEFSIARGTDLSVLAHGAGWYPDGAKPGQVGNVVVSAHRVTHNAPFHDFPRLRRGDRVIIETRTRVYTYKLLDDGDATTVPDTTLWPLYPVPDPSAATAQPTDRMLTLITCAAMFHTDNRLVARAQQISSSAKHAATA